MIINEMEPLSMAEVDGLVKTSKDEEKKVHSFIKKFIKISEKEAKKMREELEKLDILKLKKEHLVKIIDLMPEDSQDINKIFIDVSLNEDETNKLLEVVKKYK